MGILSMRYLSTFIIDDPGERGGRASNFMISSISSVAFRGSEWGLATHSIIPYYLFSFSLNSHHRSCFQFHCIYVCYVEQLYIPTYLPTAIYKRAEALLSIHIHINHTYNDRNSIFNLSRTVYI